MISDISTFAMKRAGLKTEMDKGASPEQRDSVALKSIAESLIDISETLWVLKNKR